MARSLIDELEELLFQDTKEFYLRARARRAGVRGSVSIIEPSQIGIKKTKLPGDTYDGFGRDPYENQSQNPQPQDTEQATLQSFTLELPPSSTIQTATYWPSRQYLTVSFKSGSTYSYDDVPFKVMVAWKMAPSAGSFFYYNIRTTFRYQKI
jgi:hypothetical protein